MRKTYNFAYKYADSVSKPACIRLQSLRSWSLSLTECAKWELLQIFYKYEDNVALSWFKI